MKTKELSLSTRSSEPRVKEIDALLPQTQCGQCSYSGCLPYAQAIAEEKAEINSCPPGGVKTLRALAKLLDKNPEPFIAEMHKQEKPAMTAHIRESECIGCTKCIQACPVDAIIGSSKQLHIILTQECTGCGLCLAPCPVDCIELLPLHQPNYKPQQARHRYYAKKQRQALKQNETKLIKTISQSNEQAITYIQAAIRRAKEKKQRLQNEIKTLSRS